MVKNTGGGAGVGSPGATEGRAGPQVPAAQTETERQYANLDIVMKLLRHLCSASSVAPLALLRGSPVRPAQKPQIVRDFGSSPLRVREVRTDLEFRRQFGFPGAIADA